MADFKTALEALANGKLDINVLSKQLDKLLKENPKYANAMLQQLDAANEQKKIDDKAYASLKRQINQYRRAHAGETEDGVKADSDSTVFDRQDNFAAAASSSKPAGNAAPRASGDSTQILSEEEKSTPSQSSVDFDVSMTTSDTSPSVGPATGPTGTAWEEPRQTASTPGHELGVGDVIKERFKLLDVLGVGGMGKVFKGIDLLKQEARDKNPYIAIKLLNEDFKSHPEAFISLQRESSRQQKLAHPNIATVYDFDRVGGPGTPVFITMELMEGQPLNTYIKKVVRKQSGLPFPEAFNIVKQLASALQYAHERRLVHSDFKPGNAFLCNDGIVKTLDFGIARAVKNPVTGEAEKTLFDPGKLGALTPAYASLEMLEGEEPDTRDDIYALGCVAYELLTGKHPFNKLPATTARENKLIPAPVKGLNKKQNRALRHALAFKREDRSQKVEDFIEEFEGKATWYKNPFVIAAGVLLVIGLVLINPALNYLHNKQIDSLITDIKQGDKQFIASKLDEIRTMEKVDQTKITDEAKDAIQKYFSSEIAKYIDITGDKFNFPEAEAVLKEVSDFYPDSLFLQQQGNEIEFNKKQKINDLYQEYIAALDPNNAAQDPTTIDATKGILEVIRKQIDPNHPLLTDPRPANAYRLVAVKANQEGNYAQALALVDSGLKYAPSDARLTDLKTIVQNAARVAQLNESLSGVQSQLTSLNDYKQYQKDIIELANLSTPEKSPVLATLSKNLQVSFNKELDRILKQGTRADAEALTSDIGDLLSALQLGNELTKLKLAHLTGEERKHAIQKIVSADQQNIEQKLAAANLDDPQWESELLSGVRELESLKSEDPAISEQLQNYRTSIAQLYIDQAKQTLNSNRFDAAEALVARGKRFAPALPALQETADLVAQSKAQYEKEQRVNDLKEQFKYQTGADKVAEAKNVFEKLKSELGAEDPYIKTQAPSILADSYARLAQRSADNGEYDNALKLAEAGLELNPRNAVLKGIRDEYRVQANITELSGVFKNAKIFTPDEVIDLARKVNQIEQGAPTRYPEFRSDSEKVLAERINTLAKTDENSAAALADAASTIFPTSSVLADLKNQFKLEPWPNKGAADAALSAGELNRVNSLLQAAADGKYAGHPDVLEIQKTLDEKIKEANNAYDIYQKARDEAGDNYENLRQAKKLLVRAQSVWVDNPDYDSAETQIDNLIANAPDNPSKRVIRREQVDIAATSKSDLQKAAEQWKPISSGRECTSRLAGYGTRARAICYDLVNNGWRGPLMVVVPGDQNGQKEFAIGKYEISVGDWSKYCALSGTCKPETNKEKFNDPITGITLKQAQEYVKWLSERTGKHYRLPTAKEWEYAASVGGELKSDSTEFKKIKGQLNCRVTLGDKILKGTGIADVKSGLPNQWGLKNFVGNVQEWVIDGSGATSAVGGAFSDAIGNCGLDTARPHNGNADGTTGFRVILDDVG